MSLFKEIYGVETDESPEVKEFSALLAQMAPFIATIRHDDEQLGSYMRAAWETAQRLGKARSS